MFGGSTGIGNGGVFNLSSLNGANGFKLDGENKRITAANPSVGQEISMVMGIADLVIGAPAIRKEIIRPQLCGVWRIGNWQRRGI